jgi:hypothetical protein
MKALNTHRETAQASSSRSPPPLLTAHLGIATVVVLLSDRTDAMHNRLLVERELASRTGHGGGALLEDGARAARVGVCVGGLLHGAVAALVEARVACCGADGRWRDGRAE